MAKVINLLKRLLQLPADALIASSKILPNRVMRSPYLSDKFFPYKPDQDYYVLLKSSDQGQEYSGFPIHPGHLQKCTFGEGDAPDFVEVGEAGIAMDDAMRRQRRVQLVG